MNVDTDRDIVRRAYEAFNAKDAETLNKLMSPEIVQTMPGDSPLAGTYRGPDEVLAMYKRLAELSAGTIRNELREVLTDRSGRVLAIHVVTAERNGRSRESRQAVLVTVLDGRITEIDLFVSDLAANDAFWR